MSSLNVDKNATFAFSVCFPVVAVLFFKAEVHLVCSELATSSPLYSQKSSNTCRGLQVPTYLKGI